MWTKEDIKNKVSENPILVFGKGTKEQPMCGFTARAIQVLMASGKPFEVIIIFDDPSIRPALVEFSEWPTTPQVFVAGEFIGGSDVVMEMYENGQLQPKLDSAVPS